MLTLEQIKSNYPADLFQRSPVAALIEYLQYELLDSIFKQEGSEHLSFIGGTAIRIVYQSDRFSEDIDFDNFGLSFAAFEKMLKKAVADMSAKGFIMEIRFVEKGAYHCYIKFPQILSENKLTANADEKILVRVDAVRKEKNVTPRKFLLNNFSVYRTILVNPQEVLLAQKILAILGRKREKGRDFYDTSFLLGRCDPDYAYLKSCGIAKTEVKTKILERLTQLNLKALAASVAPLLLRADDRTRVLSFKEYIIQRL